MKLESKLGEEKDGTTTYERAAENLANEDYGLWKRMNKREGQENMTDQKALGLRRFRKKTDKAMDGRVDGRPHGNGLQPRIRGVMIRQMNINHPLFLGPGEMFSDIYPTPLRYLLRYNAFYSSLLFT